MRAYSIYRSGNDTFATVLTNVNDGDTFQELIHEFQCSIGFSDDIPTIEDFKMHLINLGYRCEVFTTNIESHWWINDK